MQRLVDRESELLELGPEFEDDASGERYCGVCPHPETAHELRDIGGDTATRTYCAECDDWHEFIPLPLE